MPEVVDDLRSAISAHAAFLMNRPENQKNKYLLSVEIIDVEPEVNALLVEGDYKKRYLKELPGKKLKEEIENVKVTGLYHEKQIVVKSSSKKELNIYNVRIVFSYATNMWYAIPFGFALADNNYWKKNIKLFKEDFGAILGCFNVAIINSKDEWNNKILDKIKVCVFKQHLDW